MTDKMYKCDSCGRMTYNKMNMHGDIYCNQCGLSGEWRKNSKSKPLGYAFGGQK